jgi:hypothetical protein
LKLERIVTVYPGKEAYPMPARRRCRWRNCTSDGNRERRKNRSERQEGGANEMISVINPKRWRGLAAQVEENFRRRDPVARENFSIALSNKMAVAVARALQNREHLAVEAGTGVGKSLAYLVPAILFAVAQRKKAVVSTHTINLQEQLTEKDLPMLATVLGALSEPVKFNYDVKGRANYLYAAAAEAAAGGQPITSSEAEELQRIFQWARFKDGSLSDFRDRT